MGNPRFLKAALAGTAVTLLVGATCALVRGQAQIASIQPFVAIMVEEVAPRQDQPPTPITRLRTIAVRSDGSISRVSKMEARLPGGFLYSREVIDATARKHVTVEDYTRTIVGAEYADIQVLKAGVVCHGTPAGQINGYSVVYSEEAEGAAEEGDVIHKKWKAPQLGCYPVVQEWVGKAHGLAMDTKQTLASIKLGEPDPWYFNVPTDYTIRTADETINVIKPLLKQ